MSCGNPIKHKVQNLFIIWLNIFSTERKLTNDQIECIQFSICNFAPN